MALWGVGQAATKLLEPVPGWEVGGWIGSRADALLCRYGGEFLRGLRTTEPALNRADKERATREAYLVATVELVRRAELRKQVGSSGQRLRTAGTGETLAAMRRGVEADFQNVGITLPQPLRDVELLLEPERAPEEWRERIRETLVSAIDRRLERAGFAVTASCGVATFEAPPASAALALEEADRAMYAVKATHGGRGLGT